MVYLSTAYAPYFAMMALEEEGEHAVIFEVDALSLQEEECFPDEDYVAQGLAALTGECLSEVHDTARNHLRDYGERAEDSLLRLGNIAYGAGIPVSAITRYCVFDPHRCQSVAWAACDPIITPMNYMLCGNKYRSMIAWLFGDRADWDVGHAGSGDVYMQMMKERMPEAYEATLAAFASREGVTVTTLREDT